MDYKDPITGGNVGNEKLSSKVKKDPEFKLIPDMDHIDKLNELEAATVAGDEWFDIHRKRTMRRLEDYIRQYFSSDKSVLSAVLKGETLIIDEIIPN